MEGVFLPSLSPLSLSHLDINTVISIEVNYCNLRRPTITTKCRNPITKCVTVGIVFNSNSVLKSLKVYQIV